MATKTGELREMLITAIEQVRDGKIDAAKASSMAKLAGQINASLQQETNARIHNQNLVKVRFGSMPIGEENE